MTIDVGTWLQVRIHVEEPDPVKIRDIEGAVGKLLRWRFDEELTTELLGRDLFISFVMEVDSDESLQMEIEELSDTIGASVWRANGEFCPIYLGVGEIGDDEPDLVRSMDDTIYAEVMKDNA